jgi:acylphosphatase
MNQQTNHSAIRATVHGGVQGVGFRQFVLHRARSLNLSGWVRNREDGSSVEVYAEGEQANVSKLLEHVHTGPPASTVEKVDVEWIEPHGPVTPFEIRR